MFAGSLSSPVKPLQLSNAEDPIFVSFVYADKFKLPVKPLQPWKAYLPISVMFAGSLSSPLKPLQS